MSEEKSRVPAFATKDVLVVARALLDEYSDFNTGDYSRDYYNCMHCDGVSQDWSTTEKDIIHDLDCPVLVARDLLT